MKKTPIDLTKRNVALNAIFKTMEVQLSNGSMEDHRSRKVDLRKPVGSYNFSYSTATYNLGEDEPKRVYSPKIAVWFFRDRNQKRVRYFVAHHSINPIADACYEVLREKQAEIGNKWPNKQRIEEYLDICASFGFKEAEIGFKREKKTVK